MRNVIGVIYVLHFDPPYKHARHYVGWTRNLQRRIDRHWDGHGSRLIRAAILAGVSFTLATTFQGTRNDERRTKQSKNTPRLCPICMFIKLLNKKTKEIKNGAFE